MDYEFEEYEDVIDAETEEEFEQLEVEHDLDYWTEEAESSDAIPEDESISAVGLAQHRTLTVKRQTAGEEVFLQVIRTAVFHQSSDPLFLSCS